MYNLSTNRGFAIGAKKRILNTLYVLEEIKAFGYNDDLGRKYLDSWGVLPESEKDEKTLSELRKDFSEDPEFIEFQISSFREAFELLKNI